ncbi:sterol-sensing domain of SREBP cleavage-activation domain-containing protein [Ditylenchus destructor]|uniref:Sterol regulatory element-binding protein cleavage-activating protein n=1 Tax=Ditylenchus destructor TaxID=166010 RepID=A0AAD4ND26_9BILA|nr:sterol-sensing domain of SREBP cleavage-activation domain-containing protein [Ditylenchus destructor]
MRGAIEPSGASATRRPSKVGKMLGLEKSINISERVSRAFWDYGRLCSAHPVYCLSLSILTTIFLSYPAISKLQLPISSPMNIYWGTAVPVEELDNNQSIPEWMHSSPFAYVQHIIVKGSVEPWNSSNMTPTLAVKGPISSAFTIDSLLRTIRSADNTDLNSNCFHIHTRSPPNEQLFPRHSCLVLSPTLFWDNNYASFLQDNGILETIFKKPCTASMCARDILLGTPTKFTGIKQVYQTNRQRTIQYAITILFSRFDTAWRSSLISALSENFNIEKSRASDDQTFIHVFYVPRKYFSDYFPLLVSYMLCALYFYYTVTKFEMVKNKWALALAAFFTVLTTLSSTVGICAHFELTSTIWGSLYPYLAMVITLENILCITRSVVYTPPTLNVSSRMAHGLSLEGCSISKYFLLEMIFLLLGYLTFVPEIQEFCSFAFIGLVVDMYMQLFFYAPCLTLDLLRLGTEEKQKFSLMLFNTDLKRLKNYPDPTCPARYFMPGLFTRRRKLQRTHSDTQMSRDSSSSDLRPKSLKAHRRTLSTEKIEHYLKRETLISNRLRLLYYWTKTRFFQRLIMIFFCIWVLWLAFIVHQCYGASQHLIETAPLEWSEWQRNTFKWWPAFFAEYNISLSGHYISFLPPIAVRVSIPPDDESLVIPYDSADLSNIRSVGPDDKNIKSTPSPETEFDLKDRISWLEKQMLVFSTLLPFSIVIIFILYMCFWDRWSLYRHTKKSIAAAMKSAQRTHVSKSVDLAPLLFSRHEFPVECMLVQSPSTIISASMGGRVLIWDSNSGELKHTLRYPSHPGITQNTPSTLDRASIHQELKERSRTLSEVVNRRNSIAIGPQHTVRGHAMSISPGQHLENSIASIIANVIHTNSRYIRTQIWCMDIRHNLAIVGFSSGAIDVFNCESGQWLGGQKIEPSPGITTGAGITHIKFQDKTGHNLVLARLNGSVESQELFISSAEQGIAQKAVVEKLSLIRAHQKPVTQLLCTSRHVITSSSDCTIKVIDSNSTRVIYTLNGHDSPVLAIFADELTNMLFSSCAGGSIFCWDLEDGQLLRIVEQPGDSPFSQAHQLHCTAQLLVALNPGSFISMYNKDNGQLLSRIPLDKKDIENEDILSDGFGQQLIVLNDHLAVTCNAKSLQMWDLDMKHLIRQIRLPKSIEKIALIDTQTLLCCSGQHIYVVTLPVVVLPVLLKEN